MLTEQELTPYRAVMPKVEDKPNTEQWRRMFGDPGPGALIRYLGVLACYVETATDYQRATCNEPSWFHFRWSIWSQGTLIAHGFAEHESRAMFMADRSLDAAMDRLRDLIREHMKIARPF